MATFTTTRRTTSGLSVVELAMRLRVNSGWLEDILAEEVSRGTVTRDIYGRYRLSRSFAAEYGNHLRGVWPDSQAA